MQPKKIRGPFDVEWGVNELRGVEELDIDTDVDTEDYSNIDWSRFSVEGGTLVTVTMTFNKADMSLLAAVLPQYFVPMGGTMSTGETVTSADGAIDYALKDCDDNLYNPLDIVSCGNPGQVLRIPNARTRINGMDNDDKLRKIMVDFIGEPDGGIAAFQIFAQGGLSES